MSRLFKEKLISSTFLKGPLVVRPSSPSNGKSYVKKCPICGWSGKRFSPSFSNHCFYPDNKCPTCLSLPRHRLIWLYLKKKTDLLQDNKKLSILHIAPEQSLSARLKQIPHVSYVSLDKSHPRAIVKANIENLRFKDHSFDILVAILVLNYVKNDNRAIRELFRILKPGGWAIIQSGVARKLKTTISRNALKKNKQYLSNLYCYLLDPNCLRVYGQDYKNKFEDAGFSAKIDKYAFGLKPNTLAKFGLCRDDIYFFSKPIK